MICIHLVTSQGAEDAFLSFGRTTTSHAAIRKTRVGPENSAPHESFKSSQLLCVAVRNTFVLVCTRSRDSVSGFWRRRVHKGAIDQLASHLAPPPPLTPATPQQIGSRRRFNMLSRVEAVNLPLTAANGGEGSGLPGRTASFLQK